VDLDNVFRTEWIKLNLMATHRKEAVRELTSLLARDEIVTDEADFLQALEEREEKGSTYCGSGIAIPHGISSSVRCPAIAFGRVPEFNWDEEETPVDLIVLLAVPSKKDSNSTHLDLLSTIAVAFLDDSFANQLREVKTAEGAYTLFKKAIS
jgi:fructose-specific phosphotransferase system IIA component